MTLPYVNYLAVLVTGVMIFMLGGLWYSPALFARQWVALMGKTEAEMKEGASGAMPYVLVFFCGLLTAYVMAVIVNHFAPQTLLRGAAVGAFCWLGFAAPTSFGTATFSGSPRGLWLINSGYNLLSFVLAGVLLSAWR